MLKDVGIANRLADEQGLGVPLSALSEQLWRAASAALGPSACVLDVVRWYERATGVGAEGPVGWVSAKGVTHRICREMSGYALSR
jgi:hypothetical protein